MTRLFLAALLLCAACTKKKDAAPASPAAPVHPAAPPADQGDLPPGVAALPPDEDVKPVYSAFDGAALPLAQKLCTALHELPGQRRAACCKGGVGISFASECTKVVSAAVRSGGIKLDSAAVDRCVAAQEKAHEGCSWVGGNYRSPLPECQDLLAGNRKTGDVCRSSLECAEGLRCLGVGPLNPGRCGASREAGQTCLTAVDSLAVYAQEDLDAHHPECTGYCGHRSCEAATTIGAACKVSFECGAKNHCDGHKCVEGSRAAKGEPCAGDICGAGLRCFTGRCFEPKKDGEKCARDEECLGGCVPSTHVCGMRCDAF